MSADAPKPPAALAPAIDAAVVKVERAPIAVDDWAAVPKNLDDQIRFARWAFESKLLPDGIDSVAAAWMVLERGGELGFGGLAAFDFLYVVRRRVRMTPDAVKAKALASGLLEDAREEVVGEGDAMLARVTVKRRGLPTPVVAQFSVADAQTARLWGKVGKTGEPSAWVTYPRRMLLARARGFAYGDAFKDLTGGLQVREREDLDPGERLGGEPARPLPPRAAPGPDPLLEEIVGARAPDAAPGSPAGPSPDSSAPFPSHAEADAAINADEQRGLFGRDDADDLPFP